MLNGSAYNLLCRNHDAQVDNLKVIAREDYRSDVLSYVVHIALHRSQQITSRLVLLTDTLRLDMRAENLHGTLHRAGGLYNLRQEHLSLSEESSNVGHSLHQRTLNNGGRRRQSLQSLLQILLQELLVTTLQGRNKSIGKRHTPSIHNLHSSLLHTSKLLRE